MFLKQKANPIAIKAKGVALTKSSETPYAEEIGEIKNVWRANIGLKPIIEKIIEPVNKLNITAITGTKIFIKFEDCGLEIIVGKKLFISTPH